MSSTTPGTAITAMIAAKSAPPAAEAQPGQRVAGQRVEEDPADRDDDRDQHRVAEPEREVGAGRRCARTPSVVERVGDGESGLAAASASVLNEWRAG